MDFLKENLHIHSSFSDGKSSIKQIINRAAELNFDLIAITDHFTDSWKAKVIPSLDSSHKISNYLHQINRKSRKLRGSPKNVRVLRGIEIDLESSFEYISELIKPADFDIILFEYLESREGVNFIKKIIKYWNIDADVGNATFGLAHFNPFFISNIGMEFFIDFLKTQEIYFEFNSRYSDYYTWRYKEFFEELKKNTIPVALGSDCHSLSRLDDIQGPLKAIESYNLEKNYERLIILLDSKHK